MVKDHRGRWDKADVLKVLSDMRINHTNQKMIIEYLCEGKGLSEFDCHRQQVHARVKKVVNKLIGLSK